MTRPEPDTVGRWVGLAVGLPIIGYGLVGAVDHLPGVQLTSFARFFVGSALVHDLLLAPIAGTVAWLVGRLVPPPAVRPVRAGLAASVIVGLVAWPMIRGYGATAGEPSFLSRDYSMSLVGAWALIWVVVATVVVGKHLLTLRRR